MEIYDKIIKKKERVEFMDDVGSCPSFRKIIFNIDGVIIKENAFINAAAMAVYEKIYGEEINPSWCEENIDSITEEMFDNNNLIQNFREMDVSGNTDISYLTYLAYLIGKANFVSDEDIWEFVNDYFEETDFEDIDIFEYVSNEAANLYNYEEEYAGRFGILWQELKELMQSWYLGDELFFMAYDKSNPYIAGKSGFINFEMPMVDLKDLKALLEKLKKKGYVLGIGTKRSYMEISVPLHNWGVMNFFDTESIVTRDTVSMLEDWALYKEIFLRSAYGKNVDPNSIPKDNDNGNVLVVGDTEADIVGAKSAKMRFAAVLTGVSGKDSYEYFKELGADYILDNVLELTEIL